MPAPKREGGNEMADRRVLSIQPESGFYHRRAIKSIDKEDFPAALKHLRKAIAMEPGNLTYRMDLANTYARMGLYERSNLEIQLMLHQGRTPAEALFAMGSNFLAMGDYDQAETMLRTYEHVEPEGEYIDQADEALKRKVMTALRDFSPVLPSTEKARVAVTTGCAELRVSISVS